MQNLQATVRNGVLGGDNYLNTGIPDSRYSLPRVANESYEVPLQRVLAAHTHIDPSKVRSLCLRMRCVCV